jgi:amidase
MDAFELLDTNDAVGLASLVRSGEIGPHELLDAVATRIEQRNPLVNAIVATRIEQARAEVDAGLPDGPLRGVPFAVKDLGCDIAGMVTTFGSRLFAEAVAARDGHLARRYRRAGLVLIGKTNTPEFGKNASTEPLLHGPTRNPWRPTHSAGGSSGGSAAAVAAGLLPVAHANDGGGSIRIPAACCGLFGLKPSRGRVPDDEGLGALAYPLAAHHAVTRTVRDSAALLDVVAGPLPGDAYGPLAGPEAGSFLAALDRPTAALRIGVATATPAGVTAHDTAVRAVRRTADLLADLGHDVREAAPAWDMAVATQAGAIVMSIGVQTRIEDRLTALGRALADDDLEPFTRWLHDGIAGLPATSLTRALRDIEAVGRQVAPFFTDHDVWLSPTLAVPVPPLGLLDTTDTDAMIEHAAKLPWFTSVFNISGLPAASVPAGKDDAGLPVGVQITGRMGAEATLLQLAAQLEQVAPWPWQAPWPPPV